MAPTARLAQSAERKALNLVVVGSSPTVGALPTGNTQPQTQETNNRINNDLHRKPNPTNKSADNNKEHGTPNAKINARRQRT